MPELRPRPTRCWACLAPSAGCRLFSCNVVIAIPALSLDLGDRYEIIDLSNNPTYIGGINPISAELHSAQSQRSPPCDGHERGTKPQKHCETPCSVDRVGRPEPYDYRTPVGQRAA